MRVVGINGDVRDEAQPLVAVYELGPGRTVALAGIGCHKNSQPVENRVNNVRGTGRFKESGTRSARIRINTVGADPRPEVTRIGTAVDILKSDDDARRVAGIHEERRKASRPLTVSCGRREIGLDTVNHSDQSLPSIADWTPVGKALVVELPAVIRIDPRLVAIATVEGRPGWVRCRCSVELRAVVLVPHNHTVVAADGHSLH